MSILWSVSGSWNRLLKFIYIKSSQSFIIAKNIVELFLTLIIKSAWLFIGILKLLYLPASHDFCDHHVYSFSL